MAPLSAAAAESPEVHPAQWPVLSRAIPLNPDVESRVQQLLSSMTLEEKVGQIIQADIDFVKPEDLAEYPLGSILAGGNAAPDHAIRGPASNWLNLTDSFFRASQRNKSHHAAIPIIFGIDAVHGHAKIRGATIFPHNVGLGAAHDPALIEKIGRATAEEVSATGIDWTFAPTVAVVRDVRWGRSYESYSEDPRIVADYARAMVTGLQGKPGSPGFLGPNRTLASAKHFLGDGGTLDGRDQFNNDADEHTLIQVHGAGYASAITAGDLIVMASYNSWHGIKMHANKSLLTDVLKGRWNFPGFVVGDWNAQEEIPGCTKYSCPEMLNAGADMYMAPDSWKLLYANVLKQVKDGQIGAARLDDAVQRILRVKVLAGVFTKPAPKDRSPANSNPLAAIGSPAHRAIARQAVRESLVLLKNNQSTLPLDPHARILVTGPGADSVGLQSGGWTVDWQANHNTNADFPGATSILAGIKAAVSAAGGAVTTQLDDLTQHKPAAAIVVYGETPYAEFQGDRETLEFSPGDAAHLDLLRRLRSAHIPVVSLFMSGRPMWVNRELNLSDAFVAIWLPGTEGNGVADLLFKPRAGMPSYDFTGRLGFSWPETAMPVKFGADGKVSGALFQRGFGLTLAKSSDLALLPEDPRVPDSLREKDTLFHAGHVTAPWSIYVMDSTAEVRLTMQSQPSPAGAVTAQLTPQGVRAEWSGHGNGEFRIGGRAINLTDSQALRIHYRLEQKPQQAVTLSLRCDHHERCGLAPNTGIDLTKKLEASKPNTWSTLTVPMSCLKHIGSDLDDVSAPLALETSGTFGVTFDDIRLTEESPPSPCP